MKKNVVIIFLLAFINCFVVSCNNKELEINDDIIGREYGEWEKINSVIATTDHQEVQSIMGHGVSNKFEVSLSAEWKEIIVGTLKYELELEDAKYSGTSTYIDKGYTIDFYCRIVYDKHRIEKIKGNDPENKEVKEILLPRGPEYGWMIYDENNLLVEDTVSEGIISVKDEEDIKDEEDTKDIVEYYILCSKNLEISMEELNRLTDEELYYIRNGIYAYCGREYTEDLKEYYEKYKWYKPHISKKEFLWDYFNVYQQKTIENIVKVEDDRK